LEDRSVIGVIRRDDILQEWEVKVSEMHDLIEFETSSPSINLNEHEITQQITNQLESISNNHAVLIGETEKSQTKNNSR